MLDQAVGLLVHFCHELSIFLLLCAWSARSAVAWSPCLAAFDYLRGCGACIKLFVVAFELLALVGWPHRVVGFGREALRATLPA